ncbi:MAG: carbon storage regulator CsrA [Calditrichia bacterium]|nr:carbon storage regulator CsrA [Calditrichia bacterium]
MLVLTRRLGESVIISDSIKITIVDIEGRQVKVGIQAPKDIAIFRQEVYDRIKQENISAAQATMDNIRRAAKMLKLEKKEK